MNSSPYTLPCLTSLVRQAIPRLLEAVVAPMVVFYAALAVLGEVGALAAPAAWIYGGVAWRMVRRRPVPGTMILAAVAITARLAVSLWSGNHMVFFLPSELGTIVISLVFLASVRLNRPLVQKLAMDYVDLPPFVMRHERVRRFFARITLLWAFVLLANSTVSIWLLLHQSFGSYLLVRTAAVAVISGLAVAVSVYTFRRVLRHLHQDSLRTASATS
ncbi:hypothetical protein Misp01_00130 [Microtetraspora sp. NBRC 13810]|uniref:VC0807 family protein n=1 Tax=Microtetraspora sp. NBRC 13810 TaxID=3030990 RepID=UPI00249FBA24|nr:VC0807 family protein [Microtetraspora sp. NBRC 13810]GLW04883.1 hypothetical protein Misp01_00130 [Microtetraspora sp. NBRC 13810]